MKSLPWRHVDLRSEVPYDKKSAKLLPIRASAEMHCPIELGC